MRKALFVGASGLVGGHLLSLILADSYWESVTSLVRKPTFHQGEKLNQIQVDFDQLDESLFESFGRVDDIFCCLGTTIKKAGSEEVFKRVDLEYPLQVARLGLGIDANQFLVITALGADRNSGIFYSRTKGELEAALADLKYQGLCIFRPSLLLGDREEHRLGESIAGFASQAMGFLLVGGLRKYKPISALAVARSMLDSAKRNLPGIHYIESDTMQAYQ